VYYFAPQKCFASDGGLWIAACSPAAVARIESLAASDRWRPAGLDLGIALDNSRKNQTYNTPALATIYLTLQQVEWMNNNGGLEWAAGRSDASSGVLYDWADNHERADAFITDPALRSPVVVTVDIDDAVDADDIVAVCRAHGILDIGGYRKLGRNQLRIATFPAIETSDVEALTGCIDHVIEALA
jgi:phosphoserine aminotransferase